MGTTKRDIAQCLKLLETNYTTFKVDDLDLIVNVWYDSLKNYPASEVKRVVYEHIKTNKYAITLSEILSQLTNPNLRGIDDEYTWEENLSEEEYKAYCQKVWECVQGKRDVSELNVHEMKRYEIVKQMCERRKNNELSN